jgi:hypothetical protein
MVTMLVSLAVAIAAPAAPQRPAVYVASPAPLTVRGVAFRPAERVTVSVVSVGWRSSRTVVATRRGSFAAVFRERALDRCGRGAIRAVGNRGSVAVAKFTAPTACPPPQPE